MKKLLFTSWLLFCACALAEVPSTVAIRNAKIVPVSGAVIAKGTIVIRNGLIDAVGENVQVPAEAWVVDGEGITVYPGLIDSLSPVGIPGAAPAAARTQIRHVFIKGKEITLSNKQIRLYEKYMSRQ